MTNNKFLAAVLIVLTSVLLSGCASNQTSKSPVSLEAAIKATARQMDLKLSADTKVAIVSVGSPSQQLSEYIINQLETALVNTGKLVVVDRANLDKIRKEQGFQLSGYVSDESAKAIGQHLGAGAIVTGSFTDLGEVYHLILKAIDMQTAAIAVSHSADVAKSVRIDTMLATGGGAGAARQIVVPDEKPATTYKIGDKGPAGGWIFYDKGNNSGGWRYLEAAPRHTEFTAQWGDVDSKIATSAEIGSGKNNTQQLKTALEQIGELTRAAHRCTQLNIGGYTDWFLPSKAELALMYINLKEKGIGDFGEGFYWSSTNSQWGLWRSAWAQRFRDGEEQGGMIHNRENAYSVRAIRQF